MNVFVCYLRSFARRPSMLRLRMVVASLRQKYDPFYRVRAQREKVRQERVNLPYERGDAGFWRPSVLGLDETMRLIVDKHFSIARFGDGEFDMALGRDMGFEIFNPRMQMRLREILAHPIPQCVCAVPNVFGSLEVYDDISRAFWRKQMVRCRSALKALFAPEYVTGQLSFGDAQVSRPYMGYRDKTTAKHMFAQWKGLFCGRDLLIVEGRYTRLGVGNDLLSGAKSVRRIWCPPTGAFARYDEIISAIRRHARRGDLILLSLGATATILAYDLSKDGYWAVDSGHLDVEYIYMKEHASAYHPISGRYVNEAGRGGWEMKNVEGEAEINHVVEFVGVE